MKTLFVTIKEYIENGGKMEVGRTIYRCEERHFDADRFSRNAILDHTLAIGEFIGIDREHGTYLVRNESFKSMPLTETTGYVKIQATPIYE